MELAVVAEKVGVACEVEPGSGTSPAAWLAPAATNAGRPLTRDATVAFVFSPVA